MTREEAIASLFAIVDGISHPKCQTDVHVAATVDVNLAKGCNLDETYSRLRPQYEAIRDKFGGA